MNKKFSRVVSHIIFDRDKGLWHLVINESNMMNDAGSTIINIHLGTIQEVLEIIDQTEMDNE